MSRVAIVGSCITRDLWPVRGEALEGVLYVSRTSLPSLFSAPVAGFRPAPTPPGGLRQHQHRALVADLTKTALARLVAFRPTHLIFDFIDERFDLLSVGGALATRSWELEASGYLAQRAFRGARRIPRTSAGCEQLWLDGAAEFAALVRATPLREARLILHSARWAEERQAADGSRRPLADVEVLPGEPADIGVHNALLARYEAAFMGLMPPMSVVEAPKARVADETHQWGLSPFHYGRDYYASIWQGLKALGVSAAPGLPSVPAA
ncbi:DUF6270 domain-containing protein [Phenylobacterium sp.]|uniref:DUF6270 domain-containing protein n=1 Tax=Phenylobacterium sp. TaxID=1871053 RepID=UPI002C57D3B8|nr:DUF6270 domain-containing protein [Phenylobacterium sp.]HVI32368.1 DUF6270 domain-containing protein [Phenylobacterium sp.]